MDSQQHEQPTLKKKNSVLGTSHGPLKQLSTHTILIMHVTLSKYDHVGLDIREISCDIHSFVCKREKLY